jgi:formylglycine-generating enzyme
MALGRHAAAARIAAVAGLASAVGCFRTFSVDESSTTSSSSSSTSSSSSSSSSGGGAGGSGGGGAGPKGCAVGKPGPSLLPVPPDSPRFCIDETEVTNAHYHAFLGQIPSLADLPDRCSWKTTLAPDFLPPLGTADKFAVVLVDWCDAYAYCKAAGKRLCGKVGGGPVVPPESGYPIDLIQQGEWYYTCSGAGTKAYPYGSTYDPDACNDDDESQLEVKSKLTCEGGFPGVYDMTGGVFEWQDDCSVTNADPRQDVCRCMGGSFFMDSVKQLFSCGQGMFPRLRNTRAGNFGFRCCDDYH